jgi:hypothetical protein
MESKGVRGVHKSDCMLRIGGGEESNGSNWRKVVAVLGKRVSEVIVMTDNSPAWCLMLTTRAGLAE